MPPEENENDFDASAALSQRDKKIAEMQKKLDEYENSQTNSETRHGELAERQIGAEPDGQQSNESNRNETDDSLITGVDIVDGRLTESGHKKVARSQATRDRATIPADEEVSPGVRAMLEALTHKVESLQSQTIDTSLGLRDWLSNDDFLKWANDTPYSEFDPNSKTLAQHFDELNAAGNMVGMRSIIGAFEKKTRGSTGGVMPNANAKTITPEQKKLSEKISAKEEEIKTALRNRDFAKGRQLNAELDALHKTGK